MQFTREKVCLHVIMVIQSHLLILPDCRGLLGTVGTIAKQEGPAALWKGLEAGVRKDAYSMLSRIEGAVPSVR